MVFIFKSLGKRIAMIIGIVDDHSIVCEGYQRLVEAHGIHIAFTARTLETAYNALLEVNIDCVILDVSLPDGNGIDFIKTVLSEHPDCKILIASMYNKEPFISRAFTAGAMGYISKSEAADELTDALNTIYSGNTYVGQAVEYRQTSTENYDLTSLTDREIYLLKSVAIGKSIKTIAKELDIMPKTVHAHRANLVSKLGVRENTELLKIALDAQLVDLNNI